jgi:CRP-like cAMP-binding protein
MTETDVATALASSTFGSEFTRDELVSLAAGGRWRRFAATSVLFREGERSDSFYVVHRGHVALDMCLPARGCIRILTLGPGDVVAWSALLGGGIMTATAVALDDVELVELGGPELMSRCRSDPGLGYRLMRGLADALGKRLVATRLQLLDLFAADASAGEVR